MNPTEYPSLDYQNVPPPSYDHKVIPSQWNPSGTFNQSLGQGDVIRFNPSSKDWWDPYSAYFEVTVDISGNQALADEATTWGKIIQLDHSSHSIFKHLLITNGNTELERIQYLDVLMSMLKDLSQNIDERSAKDYEGYGGVYASTPSNMTYKESKGAVLSDGAMKTTQGYKPFYDTSQYNDSNANVNYWSTAGEANARGYTTANHVLNNTQMGFEPFINMTATTLNANADETSYNYAHTNAAQLANIPRRPITGNGLRHPYNPSFCASAFEPIMSQTLNQRFIQSGAVTVKPVTSITLHIPLFSGIFGVGMHPSNYKLIPMRFFDNLQFEIQFNEHAFFTSFFTSNQSARNYVIKKCVLHADLIQVLDQQILDNLQADYQRGIKIPTSSWYLGPLMSISNGAVPPTVQFNLGFASLRTMLFCFMPNDYTSNAAARKYYRLSMNITSMQVKIGTDYYPSLPIQGNAGTNYGPINNYQFVRTLYQSFRKQFHASAFINPHNFAINVRAFDPTSTDAALTNSDNTNNYGGYFEENRVIGKAMYAIGFDSLNYENKLFAGVNTTNTKPFELMLQYDATKPFTRPVTMHSFCHYDLVLSISPEGISVVGRS